jgi:competence CoiA-like predicted nuclease
MLYAHDEHGQQIPATPKARGTCPNCGAPLRAHCGTIITHHWEHQATKRDCDPWFEPESEWHRSWKRCVPKHRTEVVIGTHRADILNSDGVVIELQNSYISLETIREREAYYRRGGGRMLWVFNATKYRKSFNITVREREPLRQRVTYGWSRPHKTHEAASDHSKCYDLGDGRVLHVTKTHTRKPDGTLQARFGGSGWLWDKAEFIRTYLEPTPEELGWTPAQLQAERDRLAQHYRFLYPQSTSIPEHVRDWRPTAPNQW